MTTEARGRRRIHGRGAESRSRSPVRSLLVAAVRAFLLVLLGSTPATAQVDELAASCGFGGLSGTVCGPVALAAQGMQGGIGLASAGGNAFPGSGSTLGRRYGATPRVAFTGGLGFARFAMPAFAGAGDEQNVFAPSAHGQVTVGVLNGFSLAPTLGGFLSLDLLASVDAVFLPGSGGFQENTVGWGYGARLGILRESFTLPGVTLSVVRRSMDDVAWEAPGGAGEGATLDVTTTSWRAVVGKDLAGLGFTVGAGWDDYASDGEIRIPAFITSTPTPVDDLESDRAVFFAGVTKTFLVLQLGAELGWARGFAVEETLPTGYDPEQGTLFGGVTLRLTF